MKTRPTAHEAAIQLTAENGQARIVNSARRLSLLDELIRNTLETTVDRAAIVRLARARTEIEALRANLSALEGALAELREFCAIPESHEDTRTYLESK